MLVIPHKKVPIQVLQDILMMLAVEEDASVSYVTERQVLKFGVTYMVDMTPVAYERGLTAKMLMVPWYRRVRGDKAYVNTAFFNRWAESGWRRMNVETRKAKYQQLTGVSYEHINETVPATHV